MTCSLCSRGIQPRTRACSKALLLLMPRVQRRGRQRQHLKRSLQQLLELSLRRQVHRGLWRPLRLDRRLQAVHPRCLCRSKSNRWLRMAKMREVVVVQKISFHPLDPLQR